MKFNPGDTLRGFVVERAEALAEIDGAAFVMRHEASGARLLFLQNDDANKSFSISFKTPPKDDTGVFHILEHSVLCGSDKFPVKEPFVNLLKNSMQTFLNAMTFGDKTMYPVASTNEQDLMNLMDVYLDAVLHPAIYQKESIFRQEGWHVELDAETGLPEFNGVVFNEMKGALSSPDAVVYDELQSKLFPDTAYAYESGGKPAAIPGLTYESFLDHHARHYRLDNSYIVLYGNMHVERFLEFLDSHYLTPCATLRRDAGEPNQLGYQAPVKSMGNKVPLVTAPSNSYLGLGYVIGDVHDHVRLMAVDVLLDALAGSNEAPLKKAVLDADIAVDLETYVADALQQPFLILQVKGLRNGAQERFEDVVRTTLSKLLDDGLDHERLAASLSHAEFVMREGNYGMSDGVALSMASLCGWLYDDELATAFLHYEDEFAALRKGLEDGYFERLVRELFLENDHMASVELVPAEQLEEDELAHRVAELAAGLDEASVTRINEEVADLRAAQEAPDSPEALATLPHLGVADIDPAAEEPEYGLVGGTPVRCLRHQVHTRGIAYAFRYYDLDRVSFDELPYVTILSLLFGRLDTAKHTAAQLDTLLRANLGDLRFVSEVHENLDDTEACMPRMCVGSSALEQHSRELASIPDEIMMTTCFDDVERIHDVLAQRRARMEESFADSGHAAAMGRVAAHFSPAGVLREQMGGVDFYFFLCDLLDHFDERKNDLPARLSDLVSRVFVDESCLVSFAGSDEALAGFWEGHASCASVARPRTEDGFSPAESGCPSAGDGLPSDQGGRSDAPVLAIPEPVSRNEAFVVSSDVSFSAVGFDRRKLGVAHSGVWSLAVRSLSFDYLWNEVRVKGGAYGCGFQVTRSGSLRFYSFRDPRIDETLERFANAGTWLSEFDPDEDEFEGYVVSTVAGIDNPVKPRDLVRRQAAWFFAGLTPEDREKTREEVVHATPEQLRRLGAPVSEVCKQGSVVTFGNRDLIKASKQDFEVVDLTSMAERVYASSTDASAEEA